MIEPDDDEGSAPQIATEPAITIVDDAVRTDTLGRSTDAILEPELVTLDRAARALFEVFGPLVDADYLPGKTELRDALALRFELSQLLAEELCDELERAEQIRFVRTAEGSAWHIHEAADRP